jgi:hypothetical protein
MSHHLVTTTNGAETNGQVPQLVAEQLRIELTPAAVPRPSNAPPWRSHHAPRAKNPTPTYRAPAPQSEGSIWLLLAVRYMSSPKVALATRAGGAYQTRTTRNSSPPHGRSGKSEGFLALAPGRPLRTTIHSRGRPGREGSQKIGAKTRHLSTWRKQ